MADHWACTQCHSLNQGNGRCYKCRTPRDAAGVAPTDLPTIGRAAAVVPAGQYQSSAFRALIAAACIIALAVVTVVAAVVSAFLFKPIVVDHTAGVAEASSPLINNLIIAVVSAILVAMVTFAAWLSRVVSNIPPLTGAYPRATPRLTILQVFIPGLNFLWIASILREVMRMLDPRGNGDALIAAAILPLIVSSAGAGGLAYLIRGARISGAGVSNVVELTGIFGQVVAGLLAIGAVMLVAIIVRVERRSAGLAHEAGELRAVAAA